MLAQQAWAGCGTMITANTTSQWAWVTIYNVGKTIQHDYGWVKPTGGSSRTQCELGQAAHPFPMHVAVFTQFAMR